MTGMCIVSQSTMDQWQAFATLLLKGDLKLGTCMLPRLPFETKGLKAYLTMRKLFVIILSWLNMIFNLLGAFNNLGE